MDLILDLAFYFGPVVTFESIFTSVYFINMQIGSMYMAFWFNGTVKISREQNQTVWYVIFVSQVDAILLLRRYP